MLDKFVAASHAKKGGTCDECGIAIGVFNRIYKYSVVGQSGTTRAGNGPGVWVCQWCHDRHRQEERLDEVLEVDLWECAACLRMSNPVVMVENRVLCIACYQRIAVESGRLP